MARLSDLMRLVLGGATDGERLAALAALERAMAAQGVDLHEVAARVDQDRAAETASSAGTADIFDGLIGLADTIPDHEWAHIAQWILDIDANAPRVGERRRRPINARQRRFVEQMARECLTLRPTPRQGAWLLALANAVIDHLARVETDPAPKRPEPVSADALAWSGAQTQVPAAERHEPRRRHATPRTNYTSEDRMRWIAAVASAQERAPRPSEQPGMPLLFTGEELRILVCHAVGMRSWTVVTSSGSIQNDQPQSPDELAKAARTTVRSVRRALAKARASGWLRVHQPGGGRGRRSVYRLTYPHPRQWRGEAPASA